MSQIYAYLVPQGIKVPSEPIGLPAYGAALFGLPGWELVADAGRLCPIEGGYARTPIEAWDTVLKKVQFLMVKGVPTVVHLTWPAPREVDRLATVVRLAALRDYDVVQAGEVVGPDKEVPNV